MQKKEQKITYPPDFDGLSCAVVKKFGPETNLMCSEIKKLKF